MKQVSFRRLIVRDFKSFKGEHELALDRVVGLHFVRGRNRDEPRLGSNGSGKSSLWDALCWCLYGRTIKGLRNPDIKPWRGSSKTLVRVVVRVDGDKHTIERTVYPNRLFIDGDDVGPEAVVKLVGMTFEIMTNTIILGQGGELFFDVKPAAKLQLLSDAKQLERWDARSKVASRRTDELDKELNEIKSELAGFKASASEIKAGLEDLSSQAVLWDEQNAQRDREGDRFTRKNERRLEVLQREVDGFDLKYDGAMTEVKACERHVRQLAEDVRTSEERLAQVRAERHTTKQLISRLGRDMRTLAKVRECPTCGQPVNRSNLRNHHNELESQLAESVQRLSSLKTKPIKTALATATTNLQRAEQTLVQFHEKADAAIRQQSKLNPELAALKEKFATYARQKRDRAVEINPHTNQMLKLKKRLRRVRRDIDDAKVDRASCSRELERTKFWIRGFKDIKLHLIEELLQELELATAAMLEEVGLVGWSVKYAIERETRKGTSVRGINVMIGSPRSTRLVRWESWSGGEGQRLRVVGALALASVLLNHAGVDPNVEVLDEPTQHLSDEGVHDLCEFLADRARMMERTIYYCDHQSVDSVHFKSTIVVRRDAQGSRVVRGAT